MKRLLPLVVLAGCGAGASANVGAPPAPVTLFSAAVGKIVLEIDYQPNAEPYTGSIGSFADVWQITAANVARLFQHSSKQVTLPTALSQMEPLADIGSGPFSQEHILDIASQHRGTPSTGDTAAFYVVFLDGYFTDGDGTNQQTLGVSIGRTGVIAMFKPAIKDTGFGKYVEQSTLVHELGHAMGLVNDGVPMVNAHEDISHPAHCTNAKCVLYWQNEGAGSAVGFVQETLVSGSTILYGSECLDDADALAQSS